MCTQTQGTLQQVAQGVPHAQLGGNSNAMAVRSAGLFGYYASEADCVEAARTAMFTHRERSAHMGAEFFTRVTFRIIHDAMEPRPAIEVIRPPLAPSANAQLLYRGARFFKSSRRQTGP